MPSPFDVILDQTAAIEQLLRADSAGRLPHGLIFAGPTGVGKAATARALAKWFLCERGEDAATARLIDVQTHPDYHVITKELVRQLKGDRVKGTTLSVDVVRSFLLEPAGRKSVLGRGKFFVVEEADLMQAPAQNAILKTLEEPAGRTMIVLLTPRPEDLLPTIRSRTQTIRFGQLKRETVVNQLKLRGHAPPIAEAAADLCEGSLGLAMQWIDEGVVERAGVLARLLDDLVMRRAGQDIGDWLKSAADAYATQQLERDPAGSKDFATRNGINLYLRLAGRFLSQRLHHPATPDDLERLCRGIDAIALTERYLDGNVNIPLALAQLGGSMSAAAG